MNTLGKFVTANIMAAAVLGGVIYLNHPGMDLMAGVPELSRLTGEAGALIAADLRGDLAASTRVEPQRRMPQPSVVVSEGDDIVSEEVLVTATRLPAFDTLVSAAETTVAAQF